MTLNCWAVILTVFAFITGVPDGVLGTTDVERDVVVGIGVPVRGFFAEDGDLTPGYNEIFERAAKEVTALFPGALNDETGWWKRQLSSKKPSPPMPDPASPTETAGPSIPYSCSEIIGEAFFTDLQTRYPFLCFMPIPSVKEDLSYGSKPYETYVHQEWVGHTSDPSLVLTAHHAGDCILFGALNRRTGKRALFHSSNHITHFRFALKLVDELAENSWENMDVEIACGQLNISSLVFALAFNNIMRVHTGSDFLVKLHTPPVMCAGGRILYYGSYAIRQNKLSREGKCFCSGMTVSTDGIKVFDSDHANDVFPSLYKIAPPGAFNPFLEKPGHIEGSDWKLYVHGYVTMFYALEGKINKELAETGTDLLAIIRLPKYSS